MKLDDFVAETLKQIIKGVSVAQEYSESQNAKINPDSTRLNVNAIGHLICSDTGVPIQNVEFDVAISVTEGHSSEEATISVGEVSVSPNDNKSLENRSVSSIRFEVPIRLPLSKSTSTLY